MPKIVVKDMDGEIQVFKGPGLKFFENSRGVDIFDMDRANDGTGAAKIAHIKNYQWVKTEDDKGAPPPSGRTVQRTDEIDRYTKAELDQRDPHDSPDFAMLHKDTPLRDVTAPPRPRPLPDFTGPIKFPEGTTFSEHGTATVPGTAQAEPEPDPLPLPDEPAPSLDDLKAQGLIKTGADAFLDPNPNAIEGDTPAERLQARWERDGVDSMDMPAMRQWLDALPEDERIAMEEKAAEEKRRRDAERKRASRARKKAAEKKKAPPAQAEPETPDPLEQEPEARRGDEDCMTCGGRGTVPDPESEDPLDTMLCPDC